MGELGFLGMMTDPQYGGGGMDTVSYVLAMEEISKIDASASVVMSVKQFIGLLGIGKFWNRRAETKIPSSFGNRRDHWCFLLE